MKFRYIVSLILCILMSIIVQTSSIAQSSNPPFILSMDWSEDGSRFAMTTREGLFIYDQSLNLVTSQTFPSDLDYLAPHISLNYEGTQIFGGNRTARKILDTTTLVPDVDFQNADISPYTSQWSFDGSRIAFRRGDDRATQIYDTTNGALLQSFSSELWGYAYFNGYPIWSPDNAYFAGGILGNTIVIFDASTGQDIVQHQMGDEQIGDIAWSPDNENPRLAFSTYAFVEAGSPNSFPASGGEQRSIRYSLFVIDAISGFVISSITGFRDAITSLEWSPNGTELIGRDGFRRLYVWEPTTGTLIDSHLAAPYRLETLQYSPYGGRLFVAYNVGIDIQARTDDAFIPITTYEQTAFDGAVQFVAPVSSPAKLQTILSECAIDPNAITTGNAYIQASQYNEFLIWLGQQDSSVIPTVCADDLQLIAETILSGN